MGIQRRVLNRKDFGGKESEDRLNNLFTALHYDRMVPYEDDLEKEAGYGRKLWKQEEKPDPWEILAAAVIGGAAVDYVNCAIDQDDWMMRKLEAWFARNEYSMRFFRVLKDKVDACRTKDEMFTLLDSIRLIF